MGLASTQTLNLICGVGFAIASGSMILTRMGDRRWKALLWFSSLGLLFQFVNAQVLLFLRNTCHLKVDLYFFCMDRAFGQPSFCIARFLTSHHWLSSSSMMAYWFLSVPLYVLGAMYFLTQSRLASMTYVRTLLLNFGLCVPLYLMVPVAGPAHAFDGFPWVSPDVDMPQAVSFIAIPNGFPSIHTSTALLILYFARRWKVGTILASVFLVLIVLSTLGLGEHYFIDLIAGALYSAAVIWLGDGRQATVPQPLDKRWKKRAFGYLPSTITVIGRGSHRFLR